MAAAGTLGKTAAFHPALSSAQTNRHQQNSATPFASSASVCLRGTSALTAKPAKVASDGRQDQAVRCVMAPEKASSQQNVADFQRPDAMGRFGKYGGKYVPETLMYALSDLEKTYKEVTADPAFQVGKQYLFREFSHIVLLHNSLPQAVTWKRVMCLNCGSLWKESWHQICNCAILKGLKSFL